MHSVVTREHLYVLIYLSIYFYYYNIIILNIILLLFIFMLFYNNDIIIHVNYNVTQYYSNVH